MTLSGRSGTSMARRFISRRRHTAGLPPPQAERLILVFRNRGIVPSVRLSRNHLFEGTRAARGTTSLSDKVRFTTRDSRAVKGFDSKGRPSIRVVDDSNIGPAQLGDYCIHKQGIFDVPMTVCYFSSLHDIFAAGFLDKIRVHR